MKNITTAGRIARTYQRIVFNTNHDFSISQKEEAIGCEYIAAFFIYKIQAEAEKDWKEHKDNHGFIENDINCSTCIELETIINTCKRIKGEEL